MGLRVASLFSGAGGFDLGLIKAGHKIIFANDIDPDSCNTYRKNISKNILCSNISEIKISDIKNFDLLIGGFPCQGFSRANIHQIEGDSRNNLYLHILKFLKIKKPNFFLLENVKNIISFNGGRDFEEINLALTECGYNVKFKVLNAADFGVPQNRQRVFIYGERKDLNLNIFRFPNPTHSKSNKNGLRSWKSIGEALSEINKDLKSPECLNNVYSKYKINVRDFTGHRKTDPNKPSPTILARGNGGGGVCAIPHPNNLRRLSVRESAYMQTFPMNFEFTGSLGSMYRQIGNAVPVKLAFILGKQFSPN